MMKNKYKQEIIRVKKALNKTISNHLKNDYGKYLKRLEREWLELEQIS